MAAAPTKQSKRRSQVGRAASARGRQGRVGVRDRAGSGVCDVWKWLLAVLVVGAVGCGTGGYFLVTSDQGKQLFKSFKRGEKGTEVRVEPVVRGDLVRT